MPKRQIKVSVLNPSPIEGIFAEARVSGAQKVKIVFIVKEVAVWQSLDYVRSFVGESAYKKLFLVFEIERVPFVSHVMIFFQII
jgi:hypothetical protein